MAIIIAIRVASVFGKDARNIMIIIVSVFIILSFCLSSFMVLQFVSVLIGVGFSEFFVPVNVNKSASLIKKKKIIKIKNSQHPMRGAVFSKTFQQIKYKEMLKFEPTFGNDEIDANLNSTKSEFYHGQTDIQKQIVDEIMKW